MRDTRRKTCLGERPSISENSSNVTNVSRTGYHATVARTGEKSRRNGVQVFALSKPHARGIPRCSRAADVQLRALRKLAYAFPVEFESGRSASAYRKYGVAKKTKPCVGIGRNLGGIYETISRPAAYYAVITVTAR